MVHAIEYHGELSLNFKTLTPNKNTYIDQGHFPRAVVPPGPKATGIIFARMQDHASEFIVRAGDIVLKTPMKIDADRHCDGKGLGPKPTLITDQSARRILRDLAGLNPDQSELLLSLQPQV